MHASKSIKPVVEFPEIYCHWSIIVLPPTVNFAPPSVTTLKVYEQDALILLLPSHWTEKKSMGNLVKMEMGFRRTIQKIWNHLVWWSHMWLTLHTKGCLHFETPLLKKGLRSNQGFMPCFVFSAFTSLKHLSRRALSRQWNCALGELPLTSFDAAGGGLLAAASTSAHAASQLLSSVSSLCIIILLSTTTILNMAARLQMKMIITKWRHFTTVQQTKAAMLQPLTSFHQDRCQKSDSVFLWKI